MSEIDRIIREGKQEIANTESVTRERLATRYREAWRSIDSELAYVTRMLDDIDAGDLVTARGNFTRRGLEWRQQRLSGLLRLVEDEYDRLAGVGAQDIAQGQRTAASQGIRDATRMAEASNITSGFVGLNTDAYAGLTAATGPDSPVFKILQGYGPHAAQIIEQGIITGAMQGWGADKIRQHIRRQIPDGYPPYRLEALIRTETMRAYRGSLNSAYQQMGVEQVRWVAALQTRTCPACLSRHGTLYPADYVMESHPQCFVAGTVVNGPAVEASFQRWYTGDVVDIRFASGEFLTVTPNHPILTPQGWVAAGSLVEGSRVFRYDRPQGEFAAINPDYENRPAFIEDVAQTVGSTLPMAPVAVPTTAMHFHGDGAGSDISVIRTNGLLGSAVDSALTEPLLQDEFGGAGVRLSFLASLRVLAERFKRTLRSTYSIMGSGCQSLALSGASVSHACVHCGGPITGLDASGFDMPSNNEPLSAEGLGKRLLGLTRKVASSYLISGEVGRSHADLNASGFEGIANPRRPSLVESREFAEGRTPGVSLDDVVHVERRGFSGHVYNLQTSEGWYIANNIITHNCRCVLAPVTGEPYDQPTGEEWLRGLPPDQQRKVFPTQGHYDAWRDGLTLQDMTGRTRSRVWGDSVTVKPLRDIRRDAVPPTAVPPSTPRFASAEEAIEYANNKLTTHSFTMSGDPMDVDVLDTMIGHMESRLQEYDHFFKDGKLFSVIIKPSKDGYHMGAPWDTHILTVNGRFRTADDWAAMWDASTERVARNGKPWSVASYFDRSRKIQVTVDHELGHMVYSRNMTTKQRSLARRVVNQELRAGWTYPSEYAGTKGINDNEWWAEIFALYINGRNDLLTPKIVDMLDSILKAKP